MNNKFNFLKNSIFLFIGRLTNPAATIIVGLYIAKSMGVQLFGQYSFILSYSFLFSIIFSLGLNTLLSRDTAQDPSQVKTYFSNISFMSLILGLVGLMVMYGTGFLFNLKGEERLALNIMSLSIIPSILIYMWESLLVTFQKSGHIAINQIIEALIRIIFSYLALRYQKNSIALIMLTFLASRVISALLYYLMIKIEFRPLKIRIDFQFIKETLLWVPTFAGLYIFSVLLSKTDLMMLTLMKNFNDVGIYSAAYKLLEISFLMPTCLITVLFPILSRYAKDSMDRFIKISYTAIFYSLVFFIPLVLGAIIFADKIIYIVYSKDFSHSIRSFQILIISLSVYFIDQVFAHSLIANNLQKYNLKALVIATVFNILLNLALIPKFSYIGSSIATLGALVLLMLIHFYYVNKYLYKFNFADLLRSSMAINFLKKIKQER